MLVLTVRVGETVEIGTGTVTIAAVHGGRKVRLAFDFPKNVGINRQEKSDDQEPIQCETESHDAIEAHRRSLIQRNF